MSTILDAPVALGDYMLKGWVLTDHSCQNSGCKIPLLRSPTGQRPVIYLCVNCDRNPDGQQPSVPPTGTDGSQPDTSVSISSPSQITRASTPATDISESLNDLPPFIETEETRHRREQTDRASAEIGRRLLQGWTMLGDECPQDSCYYVPLVRPPKAGGEQDPRKECVLCGTIYITERDWAGRERLEAANSGLTSQNGAPQLKPSRPSETLTSSTQDHTQKSDQLDLDVQKSSAVMSSSAQNSTANISKPAAAVPSIIETLESSAEALQVSLRVLTSRLTSLTSTPALVDPTSISATAEAISKVTHALSQVKQLQWNDTQSRVLT